MNDIVNTIKIVFNDLLVYRKTIVIVLAPVIFLPLVLNQGADSVSKCAYTVLVMSAYWVTEAAPLPVTAFIPIFLFPFLGVMPDVNFLFVGGLIMAVATEECNLHKRIALRVLISMGSEPRWLMCGFMLTTAFLSMWMSNTASTAMMLPIAAAVLEELIKCYLSEAKAGVNDETNKLETELYPTIAETAINEEATVYDHLTIETTEGKVLTIEEAIKEGDTFPELTNYSTDAIDIGIQTDEPTTNRVQTEKATGDYTKKMPEFHHLPKSIQGICKSILLSICISANLGGTGTLTGTGPNLVFVGQLVQFFPNQTDITFASWLAFGVPSMLLCLVLGWIWLQIFFIGFKPTFAVCLKRRKRGGNDSVSRMLREKYEELGKITFAEGSVLFWFALLVFLWVFRDPMFIPGWNQWFNMKRGFTSDSCAAMLIGCILFVWPNYLPNFICWRKNPSSKPIKRTSLMTWSAMQQKFPWSVIILLGGGFAMADGVQVSGLARWVGCGMQNALQHLNSALVIFIFVCLITGITEVASNSATASIFIPILLSVIAYTVRSLQRGVTKIMWYSILRTYIIAAVTNVIFQAQALNVNPLYMGLPATVAASFAFMLPVATPPNAIVYECKMIRLREMILTGIGMNLLCIAVTMFSINTFASAVFRLDTYPEWAVNSLMNSSCT